MEKIKELLNEEIKEDLEVLTELDLSSDEYTIAVDNLAKLYKLKIEEEENEKERKDQKNHRFMTYILEGAGIILPLGFYAIWMNKGFKFEETGTITSKTFKDLTRFFRPTKK